MTYYQGVYGPLLPIIVVEFFEKHLRYLELEGSVNFAERFRFHYGCTITGRAWEDCDEGYISMSTGEQPVPVVLYKRTSIDGPAILMDRIVKIETTVGGVICYRHPRFHTHDEEPPELDAPTDNRALRRISLARHDKREA